VGLEGDFFSCSRLCGVLDGVVGDGASGGFSDEAVLWIEWVGLYADNFWFNWHVHSLTSSVSRHRRPSVSALHRPAVTALDCRFGLDSSLSGR
jgi:hypothetical protein